MGENTKKRNRNKSGAGSLFLSLFLSLSSSFLLIFFFLSLIISLLFLLSLSALTHNSLHAPSFCPLPSFSLFFSSLGLTLLSLPLTVTSSFCHCLSNNPTSATSRPHVQFQPSQPLVALCFLVISQPTSHLLLSQTPHPISHSSLFSAKLLPLAQPPLFFFLSLHTSLSTSAQLHLHQLSLPSALSPLKPQPPSCYLIVPHAAPPSLPSCCMLLSFSHLSASPLASASSPLLLAPSQLTATLFSASHLTARCPLLSFHLTLPLLHLSFSSFFTSRQFPQFPLCSRPPASRPSPISTCTLPLSSLPSLSLAHFILFSFVNLQHTRTHTRHTAHTSQ